MKKSLFIVSILFFSFNLFGQNTEQRKSYKQHSLNVSSGVSLIRSSEQIAPNPLLSIGYDYNVELKRFSNSVFYSQIGAKFTNQFSRSTFLNENLMYLNIPFGLVFEKSNNSNLAYNVQIGANMNFMLNNNITMMRYYNDSYVGFGCTFQEQFGLDFRYNFFGDGLEYTGSNNEITYFTNNNFMLIFNYVIKKSSKNKAVRV